MSTQGRGSPVAAHPGQTPRFRTLTPGIYAANVRGQIILLDIRNNRFHLLSPAASENMLSVYRGDMHSSMTCGGAPLFTSTFSDDDRDNLLAGRTVLGVGVNFWRLAASDVCFTPCRGLWRMLHCLHQAHRLIKRGLPATLAGLDSRWLRARSNIGEPRRSMTPMIGHLNAATLLYPRKTVCLAWSVALAYAALPQGFPLTLCIGVQNKPFYSHAWLERAGRVVGDAADLPQKMVTIYRRSWETHV